MADQAEKEENRKRGVESMKRYMVATPDEFGTTPIMSTRNERRALLRRTLADLAIAMAEAETEVAYAQCRELFELTLKQFRAMA